MRIYSVDTISLILQKSNPPKLVVMVTGTATSTGWSNVQLNSLEQKLSADGILDLELIGDPPTGISLPVLTPVVADIVIEDDVEAIIGVQVHARTNALVELLTESKPTLPQTISTRAIGEEDVRLPSLPNWGNGGPFTTLAIGEEGPSFQWGEDPPWKPFAGEKPPGFEDMQPDHMKYGYPIFGRRNR